MSFANREEWLKWRQLGVGGSDIPALLGVCKYKTAAKVYDSKVHPIVEETSFQAQLGNEMEPRIRALLEVKLGLEFEPQTTVLEATPWIRTSLDGWTPDKRAICEIKFINKKDHELAKNGKVPDQYEPQCHYNMLGSGAEVCYYASYPWTKVPPKKMNMEDLAVVVIKRNPKRQAELFEVATNFWKNNVLKRAVPTTETKDFAPIVGLSEAADRYRVLLQEIAERKEELDFARNMMVEAAEKSGAERAMCAGIKLTKKHRKGNVDYSKVPQLKGVDLELFRKPETQYWELDV